MKVLLIILMFNGVGNPIEKTYPVDNIETCLKILEASKIDKPILSDEKTTAIMTCSNPK